MLKKCLKDQMIERRVSPRKRLKTMVKVTRQKESSTEKILNYSLTGLFFKCNLPEQYMINDKVKISFKDENNADQVHIGHIVRKSIDGVAIQYHKKTMLNSNK